MIINLAAIDSSLTSLGLARAIDGLTPSSGPGTSGVEIETTQLRTTRKGHARLDWLLEGVAKFTAGMDLVGIEGPSFNSKNAFSHETDGLWWLIAHQLHRDGVPYVQIPPASIKKYATGNGNAPKPDVFIAAVRRFPAVEVTSGDAADALWLLAMMCERYGCPMAEMPKDRTALLYAKVSKKGPRHGLPVIDWPKLGTEVIPG